ncbi:MAG: GDP-mannose 4,6-dehydratase, partial [Methanosarcinales archaeon]
ADKICEAFYKSYSIPIVTIRPFNTYGPRQSPRAIIPTIILQLIRNDRLELGNLEPKRDFTYVKDTINGLLLGGIANAIGEEINLGSGTQISIRELAKLIMKIMSKECEIVIDKKRIRPKESDVMSLISDNKKAREILGWKPKIGLEEGLKLTINWFKENEKEYEDTYYL